MTVKRTIGTARSTRIGSFKAFSVGALFAVGLLGSACTVNDLSGSSAFNPPSTETPSTSTPAANPKGTGETASAKIDNSTGGVVTMSDGTSIEVPPGALPEGVETITVTSSPEPAPADYKTVSPVFVFGPDGTVFLKPLKVSIPFTAPAGTDTSKLTMLWSRARGDGFDMVQTEFSSSSEGYEAAGEVTHFSQGMVGEKYETDPRPSTDPYADKK